MKRLLPLALAAVAVAACGVLVWGQTSPASHPSGTDGAAARPTTRPAVSPADLARRRTEYASRVKAISETDVKAHHELAVWCDRQGLIAEARRELVRVLQLEPGHLEATKLLQTLPCESQDQWMSQRDILRVRLAELRSTDKVRIAFNNNVLDRYIESQKLDAEAARAFRARKPVDKAIEILVTRPNDHKLLEDIHVLSNPDFMSKFRLRVWPVIRNSCASVRCHGAPKGAGRLKLFNADTTDDAFYYSNFYILDSYQGRAGRLINRNAPARSLLLQFGLPRPADPGDIGEALHPKPLDAKCIPFRDKKDPAYRTVDEWIRALCHPRADYQVDYLVPCRPVNGEKPTTTQPAKAEPEAGSP